MKTALKIICIILTSILILTLGIVIYCFTITKDAKLDSEKLINLEKTVSYYDSNEQLIYKTGDEKSITELKDIPIHVQNAFVAIEDKRFYKHNGVDYKGLFRAMFTNLKSFSFKEGGSTISQQLIKNTHLSNKKTFKRKLTEIKLAKKLEKKYTKNEILEKYLNTIYFGDNCYGITEASSHYFDKSPSELSINEGATLAAIIKAPSNYSPIFNNEKCKIRKDLVLNEMLKQGYIDQENYAQNYGKDIIISQNELNQSAYNFQYLVKKELNEILDNYPFSTGNLKVYTTLNENTQKLIENEIDSNKSECDKSIIILNKNGEIEAYYSTCGDIYRQVGSTIKPLLVYAPAIENDVVYSCTPILDEKTNFNGYSPSNYNDKYYGYISVKESLAKSLNTCSVKILNYTGIEKSKEHIKKTDISLTENDNSLCLALGATEKGATLTQLTSAYSVFLNSGQYCNAKTILRIENENNGLIYNTTNNKNRVFSPETTHIMNDMLELTVKDGTAKKLSFTNIPLCAKTGTVGNEKGNFDAYSISYNSEKIIGVWLGNKDNSLMKNSITGGTIPTNISSSVWKEIYKEKTPPKSYLPCSNICEKEIDKIEYDTNNNVLLANELTPKRFVIKSIFKNGRLPNKSDRFQNPTIKEATIYYKDNSITINLSLEDYYNAYIYKKVGNEKILVYDTYEQKKQFIDRELKSNCEYEYSVIPYIKLEKNIIKGKEIILRKIKTPAVDIGEWWRDDLR